MTRRRGSTVILATIAVTGVVALAVATQLPPIPPPIPVSTASPSIAYIGPSGSTEPSQPASPSAVPSASPSAVPSASPSAASSPGPSQPTAAPTTAAGFKLRSTVVSIAFPLPPKPRHHYLDGWLVRRAGRVYPYEEARGRTASGALIRAHSGVDIAIPVGVRVLAAFSGVVVDPRTIWKPWDPSRYGRVVVIRSTEPTSSGYYAIAAHLSKVGVEIGEVVTRGQVVGLTGRTGNAVSAPVAHLHFELRAPFLIDQRWGGVHRRLDAFDPKPSLLAADPAGPRA